ncbi:MAG: hypothetical protein HYW23_04690 [Candidatus Aenigmarchaeota archaeon]|nr:hypothetical protein [Candidatus Aenigmarchaeota archaeon]
MPFKRLHNIDELVEELSSIQLDGNRFVPQRVEFIVKDRTRTRYRTVKDNAPRWVKLNRAYEDGRDVREADFYDSKGFVVILSFTDGMKTYGYSGVTYIGNEPPPSRYIEITHPFSLFAGEKIPQKMVG